MRLLYIEDSDIDAENLSRIARRDGRMWVTHSSSFVDLEDDLAVDQADGILIDVMRPEALSVEDDVVQARRFSQAPIVFVTGGDSQQIRRRALKAGAEAVLDKSMLSADMLHQAYANASARGLSEPIIRREVAEAEPEDSPNYNMQNLVAPLDYVESGLMTMVEGLRDAGKVVSAEFVDHIFSSVRAMKVFAKSDLGLQTLVCLDEVLADLENQRVLVRASNQNWDVARVGDVALAVDVPREHYWQIGPTEMASLGFRHLLQGLLKLARPSDKLALRVEREGDGPRLVFYLSRALVHEVELFFTRPTEQLDVPSDALASLHLAALLLVLRHQQIDITPMGRGQKITVYL